MVLSILSKCLVTAMTLAQVDVKLPCIYYSSAPKQIVYSQAMYSLRSKLESSEMESIEDKNVLILKVGKNYTLAVHPTFPAYQDILVRRELAKLYESGSAGVIYTLKDLSPALKLKVEISLLRSYPNLKFSDTSGFRVSPNLKLQFGSGKFAKIQLADGGKMDRGAKKFDSRQNLVGVIEPELTTRRSQVVALSTTQSYLVELPFNNLSFKSQNEITKECDKSLGVWLEREGQLVDRRMEEILARVALWKESLTLRKYMSVEEMSRMSPEHYNRYLRIFDNSKSLLGFANSDELRTELMKQSFSTSFSFGLEFQSPDNNSIFISL